MNDWWWITDFQVHRIHSPLATLRVTVNLQQQTNDWWWVTNFEVHCIQALTTPSTVTSYCSNIHWSPCRITEFEVSCNYSPLDTFMVTVIHTIVHSVSLCTPHLRNFTAILDPDMLQHLKCHGLSQSSHPPTLSVSVHC